MQDFFHQQYVSFQVGTGISVYPSKESSAQVLDLEIAAGTGPLPSGAMGGDGGQAGE